MISKLKSLILKRNDQSPGLERSNSGGWHSDTDMLDWGGRPAQKLAQTAINIAKRVSHIQESSVADREWLVRMWANVTPAGGLNHLHSHLGNLWAAVLYIDMGHEAEQESRDAGGSFYLDDPRFPMAAMRDNAFRMRGGGGRRPASAAPD